MTGLVEVLRMEAFTFVDILGRDYAWDVTNAKALAADPANVATVTEVDLPNMQGIATNNSWTQERVDQVDASVPGIGAPVCYQGETFYILIDGTHRCVRALQAGQPYRVRLLTHEAARACILKAPEGSMPWDKEVAS